MKKILLIVLILVLLGLVALAIFVATFDLDHYRTGIAQRLEEALERPVQIGKIAWGWHEGLALNLEGFSLYSDNVTRQEVLRLKSVGILVNLGALLNKRLEISSIFLIEPSLHLVRTAEGKFRGFETKRKKKLDQSLIAALVAASLTIEKIGIEKGEVVFQDESRDPPLEIRFGGVQSILKNVAWNRPIQVQAGASFLGPRRNLDLAGQIRITPQGPVAENIRLKGDLNAIDWDQAQGTLPFLRGAKFQKGTGGKFVLVLPVLTLTEEGLENLNVQFELENGKIVWPEISAPLERMNASARLIDGRFEVEDSTASFAEGQIQATGAYNSRLPNPLAVVQLQAEGIDLDRVFPPASSKPRLQGRLAAVFQGNIQAAKGSLTEETLAGKGTVRLDDAAIRNFNFLREVFSRISIIPGLIDKLVKRLPANYQERLLSADTYLDPIELAFVIDRGIASFNQLVIAADSFQLAGTGQVNLLDQTLVVQTMLYIEPELSKAFIRSVNELEYLADAEGRLQIPLIVKGTIRDISLRPELQYIASRLAVSKAADVVSEWLFKKKDRKDSGQGAETGSTDSNRASSTQQGSSAQNLLGALLQNALQSRSGGSQER